MFGHFQLSDGSLVQREVRPKHQRSSRGCLLCRERKKKCDGVRPVCTRCRKASQPVACVWPHFAQVTPNSDDERRLASKEKPEGSVFGQDTCQDPATVLTISDQVAQISPSVSPTRLVMLVYDFEHRYLGAGTDLTIPVLGLSMSQILSHAGLQHAWVCVSAMFASSRDSSLGQVALVHYDRATSLLKRAMASRDTIQEWCFAAVLLSHMYEKIRPIELESDTWPGHLLGVHSVFDSVRSILLPPSTPNQYMLLDAYIYRTAINELFQPRREHSLSYLDELISYVQAYNRYYHSDMDPLFNPWTGDDGVQLFDTVYRLSWLLRQPTLTDAIVEQANVTAAQAETKLSAWEPTNDQEDTLPSLRPAPHHTSLTARAYRLGCACLAAILQARTTGADVPALEVMSSRGLECLHELQQTGYHSNVLLWPVAVLGVATEKEFQRQAYADLLASYSSSCGIGAIQRITAFLQRAWKHELSKRYFQGDESLFTSMYV